MVWEAPGRAFSKNIKRFFGMLGQFSQVLLSFFLCF